MEELAPGERRETGGISEQSAPDICKKLLRRKCLAFDTIREN